MDDLATCLLAEMAEQSLWTTCIPSWHPRNEGDPPADPPAADPPEDPPDTRTDAEKAAAASQEAVDKAHAKLRASEKETARLAALVKKHERSGLEETDRLKQEAEDARAETAALQAQLDAADRKDSILGLATAMKFRDPARAARLVPAGVTDEAEIRKELKSILADFPELKTGGSAAPPVNGDTRDSNGSTNARMNAALRQAAGRS